jgi:hypothetical protein
LVIRFRSAGHVGIEKAEIEDLDIEVVAVLRPLRSPFAVDEGLVRHLDSKHVVPLFIPGTTVRATKAQFGATYFQDDEIVRRDILIHMTRS